MRLHTRLGGHVRSPSWCITFLHLPSLRIICDRCGENRIGKHDGETIARSRCPLPEYLPSDTWERQRAPAERHRPPRATGATTYPGSFSWGSRLAWRLTIAREAKMKLRGRRLLSTAAYTAWAARRTLSGRRLPATATWATCGGLRARAWGSRLGCAQR